jgi:HipA-like protein
MTSHLVALLNGREIGRVTRDSQGRLAFVCIEDWRQAGGAYPLSLSMPLASAEHRHKAIEGFLWGLLPDNANVLDRWGPALSGLGSQSLRTHEPRIREFARRLPDALSDICRAAEADGLDHPLIERLSAAVTDRAQRCAQALDANRAAARSNA